MANDYDFSDLPLHGSYTHDGDYFTLYTELNGVRIPVQRLSVADFRELFTDAANAKQTTDQAQPAPQSDTTSTAPPDQSQAQGT